MAEMHSVLRRGAGVWGARLSGMGGGARAALGAVLGNT